jgi:6-phosphofructokinase 1
MPAVIRTSNNPYTWEIGMGELKDIANVEKMMPMDYISDDYSYLCKGL